MRLGRARRHSNTAGDELTARQANTPGPDRIAQERVKRGKYRNKCIEQRRKGTEGGSVKSCKARKERKRREVELRPRTHHETRRRRWRRKPRRRPRTPLQKPPWRRRTSRRREARGRRRRKRPWSRKEEEVGQSRAQSAIKRKRVGAILLLGRNEMRKDLRHHLPRS